MRSIFKVFTILLIILVFTTNFSYAEKLTSKYDILQPFIKIMAADDEFL